MAVIELRPFDTGHYPHYKYMMFMIPILLDAHVVVETGFQDGCSSNIFLKALSQLSGDRELYTYEFTQPTDAPETILIRNKALETTYNNQEYSAHWYYFAQDSVEGAKDFKNQVKSLDSLEPKKVDFLYLDSDHKDTHVFNELANWSNHLSDKAIIMIDDAWNYEKQERTGPMIGAERWLRAYIQLGIQPMWKILVFPEKHGPIVMYR